MVDRANISVEIAYATQGIQLLIPLDVPAGTPVVQALSQSGLLQPPIAIDLEKTAVGIFGKICTPDTPLEEGDRLEIYQPLRTDPKESRRKRADQ